ncbi:MAG: GGDEF domain-containing protein [Chloroflexota bacterium]
MPDNRDFYKDLIDNLYDGVYFLDRDRTITYWNKGAERITGYSSSQTIGRSCRDNLLNHVTANGVQLCAEHCPMAAVMVDGTPREAEVFLHHANGHRVPVLVRATALRDKQGNIVGAVESFSNNAGVINARREARQMRRVAFTDPLTGIGNRKHLDGRLSAAIAEFKQNHSPIGLIFLDIDHFKKFNDTYGHDVGDKVLRMVANTLHHALRATDTTGRWGGEEFLAILYGMPNHEALSAVAEKLRTLVEHSRLDIDNQGLTVTISIGATLMIRGDTVERIVRRADGLMYQSKQGGRNRATLG